MGNTAGCNLRTEKDVQLASNPAINQLMNQSLSGWGSNGETTYHGKKKWLEILMGMQGQYKVFVAACAQHSAWCKEGQLPLIHVDSLDVSATGKRLHAYVSKVNKSV